MFRSQTSDNMDRWRSRGGKSQRREEKSREEEEKRREEERRSEKRKSQRKEDAGAREGSKAVKHHVLPMIFGSGGSESRLAKAAGAEPSGQIRDEKVHAAVARSTLPSQHVKNTTCSDDFRTLRCRFAWQAQGIVHLDCAPCQKQGAALCMTWHHFFGAGAILQRHGREKSPNALVRGRRLCTQRIITSISKPYRVRSAQNHILSQLGLTYLVCPRGRSELAFAKAC